MINGRSSSASPGQSERRDRLARIFDGLDGARQQALLRVAVELAESHQAREGMPGGLPDSRRVATQHHSSSLGAVPKVATTGQFVQDVYRSSNGDHWQLIRDSSSGRVFVRHEAIHRQALT